MTTVYNFEQLSYANKERHRYHNHALVLRLMTTELKTPKDIVQHEKEKDKPTNSMLKTGNNPFVSQSNSKKGMKSIILPLVLDERVYVSEARYEICDDARPYSIMPKNASIAAAKRPVARSAEI